MREILFRGKRVDNGEWISSGTLLTLDGYGEKEYFIPERHGKVIATLNDEDKIEEGVFARVDPSTVGQYTGLTDKNGKKIFEGDIVEYHTSPERYYRRGVVEFCTGCFVVKYNEFNRPAIDLVFANSFDGVEIIGNIYDNQELLEA